jgi:type I restriction enzyme M protein
VSEARRLVDKLWSYCNVLRDDGVGTIEYTEQLTYLLFLKMAHERATRKLQPEQIVPTNCSWQRLLDADGDDLEVTYRHILETLGKQPGTLGVIFRKAQNRIQDPAKLKRLIVDLIDKENWSATGTDIKGDAYEELLSKGAEDIKSGAGQYFTPRSLIQAMIDCVQPTIRDSVVDPAAGRDSSWLRMILRPRMLRSSPRPSVSTYATPSSTGPSWLTAQPVLPR